MLLKVQHVIIGHLLKLHSRQKGGSISAEWVWHHSAVVIRKSTQMLLIFGQTRKLQ